MTLGFKNVVIPIQCIQQEGFALFFHMALNLSGKFITLSSVLVPDSVHDLSLEVITLIAFTVEVSVQELAVRSRFEFQSATSNFGQVRPFVP